MSVNVAKFDIDKKVAIFKDVGNVKYFSRKVLLIIGKSHLLAPLPALPIPPNRRMKMYNSYIFDSLLCNAFMLFYHERSNTSIFMFMLRFNPEYLTQALGGFKSREDCEIFLGVSSS